MPQSLYILHHTCGPQTWNVGERLQKVGPFKATGERVGLIYYLSQSLEMASAKNSVQCVPESYASLH